MNATYYATDNSSYLKHHGVLGQKWGIRRYQNEDGTYTDLGKVHNRRRQRSDDIYLGSQAMHLKASEKKYKEAKANKNKEEEWDALLDAVYNESKYKNQVNKYVKKWGQTSFDELNIISPSNKYGHILTENAVDDMIRVFSNEITKDEYNEKYYGTGFRMT